MAKGKGKAVPSRATSRDQKKIVKTNKNQDLRKEGRPSWRFSTVDKEGPFAWPKGQPQEVEIIGKLHSFDSMAWADITGKPRIICIRHNDLALLLWHDPEHKVSPSRKKYT